MTNELLPLVLPIVRILTTRALQRRVKNYQFQLLPGDTKFGDVCRVLFEKPENISVSFIIDISRTHSFCSFSCFVKFSSYSWILEDFIIQSIILNKPCCILDPLYPLRIQDARFAFPSYSARCDSRARNPEFAHFHTSDDK